MAKEDADRILFAALMIVGDHGTETERATKAAVQLADWLAEVIADPSAGQEMLATFRRLWAVHEEHTEIPWGEKSG